MSFPRQRRLPRGAFRRLRASHLPSGVFVQRAEPGVGARLFAARRERR